MCLLLSISNHTLNISDRSFALYHLSLLLFYLFPIPSFSLLTACKQLKLRAPRSVFQFWVEVSYPDIIVHY